MLSELLNPDLRSGTVGIHYGLRSTEYGVHTWRLRLGSAQGLLPALRPLVVSSRELGPSWGASSLSFIDMDASIFIDPQQSFCRPPLFLLRATPGPIRLGNSISSQLACLSPGELSGLCVCHDDRPCWSAGRCRYAWVRTMDNGHWTPGHPMRRWVQRRGSSFSGHPHRCRSTSQPGYSVHCNPPKDKLLSRYGVLHGTTHSSCFVPTEKSPVTRPWFPCTGGSGCRYMLNYTRWPYEWAPSLLGFRVSFLPGWSSSLGTLLGYASVLARA